MPRIRLSRVVVAAVCGTVAVAAVPTEAAASPAGRMVRQTNHARDRHGLRLYRESDRLATVAHRWARWMASHHTLLHNPNLTQEIGHWCYLGENIGRGPSERWVQRAFMHDTSHRRNLLSKHYTQIGIGTHWTDGGTLYVDQVFRRPC